jgi:pimeloyl-ACP methyl ester carboxylesterase
VLGDLKAHHVDYWGYSMGGRIGFALARFARGTVHSLIIGGAAADGRSRIGDSIRAAIRKGGVEGLVAMIPDASPQYKTRLLASDSKVLDAMRVDSLGFADIPPSMTMPCRV